jgi:hypothetical protein
MGRRRYVIDEQKVRRFLAEGRGQGSLDTYNPWLHIQDVPSRGRSHRPFGIKTGRVHHLLSDGEMNSFLMVEQDPTTLDIREQFPMDRLEYYRAALDLGVPPPRTTDGTPFVMTVDFLVTQRHESTTRLRPLSFKYSTERLTERQRRILDVTALYWRRRGLTLEHIDETFLDETLLLNYAAVRAFHAVESLPSLPHETLRQIAADLRDAIERDAPLSMLATCRALGLRHDVSAGDVFNVVRHLLARGVLRTDLSASLPLEKRELTDYTVVKPNESLPWR